MRLLLFIALLLVLGAGLAAGCGRATSTTSETAAPATATSTTAAASTGATATPSTAVAWAGAAQTTIAIDPLTAPTYPTAQTTEATKVTLDAISQGLLAKPYMPFFKAVCDEVVLQGREDSPLALIGSISWVLGSEDQAHGVVLRMSVPIGDYTKFRDAYDERAWRVIQAVSAFHTDDEYVDLLEGNPLPPFSLSLDDVLYEVSARVMTGIADKEVNKESWLRATGR